MDQSKDSRKVEQPFSYAAAAKRGQRSDKNKSASEISSGPASASKPATPAQKKQPESPRNRKPTSEPHQPTWVDAHPPTRHTWGSSQSTPQAQSNKKQPPSSDSQWTDAPLPSTPAWGLKPTPKSPSHQQQEPQSPKKPFISPAQELLAKHLEAANKTHSPEKEDVTKTIPHSSKQRLEAWFKQPAVSTTATKLTYAQAIASSSEENNPPSTSKHISSPAPSQSSAKSQSSPKNRSSVKTQTEVQTPIRALSPIESQPSARATSPTSVIPFCPATQPSIKSLPSYPSQSPVEAQTSGRIHSHAKSRSASGIQLPTQVPSSLQAQPSSQVQSPAQVVPVCGNQPSAQAQLPAKPRSPAQVQASTSARPSTETCSPVKTLSSASLLSPTKSRPSTKVQPSVGTPFSTRNRNTSRSPSPVKAQLLARIQAITSVSATYNRSPSTKARASGRAPSFTKHQPSSRGPSARGLHSQVGRQSPTKSQLPVRGRSHSRTKSAPQAQLATTIQAFTHVERIENRPRSSSLPFSYIAAVRNNVPATKEILPSRPITPPSSSPAFESRQGYRQTGGIEPEIIYPQTPTHQIIGAYSDDPDEGSPTPRASARKPPSSSGSSTPTQATWSAKQKAAAAQNLAMAHQFELIERVRAVLAEQSNMKRHSPGHNRPSSDSGILPKRTASRTQPGFNSAGTSPVKGSKAINRKGKDREILIPRVLPPVVRRGAFLPFDVRYDEQQRQQQQQHQEQSAAPSLPPPTAPSTPEPAVPAPSTPPAAPSPPSPEQEKQHPSPPRVPNPAATRAALTNVRILQLALKRALRRVGSWEDMTGDGHDEDRYWRRADGQFFCAFDEEYHEVAGLGQGRPRRPNPNRRARHMRRHLVLSPRGRHAWRPDAEAPAPAPAPPPPAPAAPLSPIREEEEVAESSSLSVGPASSEVGSAASPVVAPAVPSPPAVARSPVVAAAASPVAAVPAVVPSSPPAAASSPMGPAVPVAAPASPAASSSAAASASSSPPPVESATTPVAAPAAHVSPADSVDTHIGVILSSEERRRRAAMRRALTSNWSLWEHQYGWDVLVRRRDQTWRLHREVLSTQSVYFRDRLAGQGPWVIDCDLHERWQLGSALAFMYLGRYEGSGLTPGQPLDGIPVYRNVAAYVAGASVDCPSMMAFAVRALEEIRAALIPVVLTGLFRDDPDVHLFHEPLRLALADMYAQSDGPLMEPLRLAMARLVDVVLVSLWGNDAFQVVKHEKWMEKLFPLCYYDSVRFHQSGLLVGPVSWDRMEILSPR